LPVRFILDCDTGSDDAIAIFAATAHPDLDLVALTTVNGNVSLDHVTDNTLRARDHVGDYTPVYRGAERPLVRPDLPIPRDILNADSDFQVEEMPYAMPLSPTEDTTAVDFLVEAYMDDANADVQLVATGPLTNIALALAKEPRLAERIPRLVVMGGAHENGNVTAAAEFNFWVDPEAADAVLSAGIRDVVIVPLDATHSAPLSIADCDEYEKIGTRAATATANLLRQRIAHDQAATAGADAAAPVHDPMCVAYLLRPDLFTETVEAFVSVETTGERTLGELLVDTRPWRGEPANATVALRASAEVYRDFLRTAFELGAETKPRAPEGRIGGALAGRLVIDEQSRLSYIRPAGWIQASEAEIAAEAAAGHWWRRTSRLTYETDDIKVSVSVSPLERHHPYAVPDLGLEDLAREIVTASQAMNLTYDDAEVESGTLRISGCEAATATSHALPIPGPGVPRGKWHWMRATVVRMGEDVSVLKSYVRAARNECGTEGGVIAILDGVHDSIAVV
jgi:inosine-uridine nucleoside N-ribohydrolase